MTTGDGSRRHRGAWIALALGAAALTAAIPFVFRYATGQTVTAVATRVATGWLPPQVTAGPGLRRPEVRALRSLAGQLDAEIVWSSNRSGNHELYIVQSGSGELRQLTSHPHVDFASRFSPDGTRVAFLRSRREWVSFREIDSWDLYVIGRDGSGEHLVAEHAYHPTWTADGGAIVFHRGPRIFRVELSDGAETLIWDAAALLEDLYVGDPELEPNGRRLAFAVRGVGAMVTVPATGEYVHLTESQVCQTTWIPDTEDLLWVAPEGNGGTRIMRGAADGSKPATVLIDLPGERSHEYFPALSDDAGWLVWGAAATGHEHDRADYDIYLWKLGSDWASALRLTFSRSNDQWPDIHLRAGE